MNPEAYEQVRAFRNPVVATHDHLLWVILGLVALHVAAVVMTELRHGGTLVSAMITGRKTFHGPPVDLPSGQP